MMKFFMMFLIFLVCLYINYKLGSEGFYTNSDETLLIIKAIIIIIGIVFCMITGINVVTGRYDPK